MVRVGDVVSVLDQIWPRSGADEWDNVGLLVGDFAAEVAVVQLAVDVTETTIDEAVAAGAQLLIAHHPLTLDGQKRITSETALGRAILKCIKSDLAIMALHTNADHPEFGVSEAFAHALGLDDVVALDESTGHGRLGKVSQQSLRDLVSQIARALPGCSAPIRVAGDPDRLVQKVGLLAGSGANFMSLAKTMGVDVFITSDIKHHQALDFLASDSGANACPALVDVSHWASESIWLEVAAEQLGNSIPSLKVGVSKLVTDPWSFSVQP